MQLHSSLDKSVNFIEKSLEGFLESRYVRKVGKYFICYLSSQTGCNRGCRFCHLTATKQTKFQDSQIPDFCAQARDVFKHYKQESPAQYVHFNFMARGEPLASKVFQDDADGIFRALHSLTHHYDADLGIKYNVSSILPNTLTKSLPQIFKGVHPTLYYSMYSANPECRAKWLPSALDLDTSLELLQEYQSYSKKIIKIHHCLIEGENDSEYDAQYLASRLSRLTWEFNLVRYNPFSELQGKESSEETIENYLKELKFTGGGNLNDVKVIPRVGVDVFASCGTFPTSEQVKTFHS